MAVIFNGSSDKYSAGSSVVSNSLTFSAWIWPNDTGTNRCAVAVGSNDNENFAALYLDSTEHLNLYVRMASATDRFTTSIATISTSGWTHVGAVFNHISRIGRVYINGVQDAIGTDQGAGTFGTLTETRIGCRNIASDDFFFDGKIADVAVRNIVDVSLILFSSKRFTGYYIVGGVSGSVLYQPMIRGPNAGPYWRGPSFTATGTTDDIVNHPSLVYPRRRHVVTPPPPQKLRPYLDVTRGGWKVAG